MRAVGICPTNFLRKVTYLFWRNGFLFPNFFVTYYNKKMFWGSRKTFEVLEFAKILRSLDQIIPTVKGEDKF